MCGVFLKPIQYKMKTSFLLGSGFSPEPFPRVKQLNERLLSSVKNKILLENDSIAHWKTENVFTKELLEKDGKPSVVDRKKLLLSVNYSYLLSELMLEYLRKSNVYFNYEDFFSWFLKQGEDNNYTDLNKVNEVAKHKIEKDFGWYINKKVFLEKIGINEFNKLYAIFNYLIRDALFIQERFKIKSYSNFIELINENLVSDIFTLNHDIFLEELLAINKIKFSDGFSIEKSNLLGCLNQPLKVFSQNNFLMEGVNIYKLHGSIDNYKCTIFKEQNYSSYTTRDVFYKIDYYRDLFHKKDSDENEEGKGVGNFDIIPQFLTGRGKEGIIRQSAYYSYLIKSFEESLKHSDRLIIVGFSYNDKYLVDIVLERFRNSNLNIINVNPADRFPFSLDGENDRIFEINSISELTHAFA